MEHEGNSHSLDGLAKRQFAIAMVAHHRIAGVAERARADSALQIINAHARLLTKTLGELDTASVCRHAS